MSRSRVYVDRNRMEKEQEDAMVMCSLILLHNSGHLLFDLLIACAKRQRLAASRTFAYVSVGFRDSNFSSKYPGFPFAKSLCHLAIFLVPTRYIKQKSTKPRGRCSRQPPTFVRIWEILGFGFHEVGWVWGWFHPVGSEVWMALVLLGTWVGLEYFWLFLLDFVLAGRSATWRWKLHVPHVLLQYYVFLLPENYSIFLWSVYMKMYIFFSK